MTSASNCAARNTIVIDVEGIDASVLIRLMHYAELPIPTTEAQGAFSLNIRSAGVCSFNRTLLGVAELALLFYALLWFGVGGWAFGTFDV